MSTSDSGKSVGNGDRGLGAGGRGAGGRGVGARRKSISDSGKSDGIGKGDSGSGMVSGEGVLGLIGLTGGAAEFADNSLGPPVPIMLGNGVAGNLGGVTRFVVPGGLSVVDPGNLLLGNVAPGGLFVGSGELLGTAVGGTIVGLSVDVPGSLVVGSGMVPVGAGNLFVVVPGNLLVVGAALGSAGRGFVFRGTIFPGSLVANGGVVVSNFRATN